MIVVKNTDDESFVFLECGKKVPLTGAATAWHADLPSVDGLHPDDTDSWTTLA